MFVGHFRQIFGCLLISRCARGVFVYFTVLNFSLMILVKGTVAIQSSKSKIFHRTNSKIFKLNK